MKKEMILRNDNVVDVKSLVMAPIERMAKFVSFIMEEEISPLQLWYLLQTVLSFMVLVFSVGVPILVRLVLLAWFALSVWQCKRIGLGE